MLSLMLQGSAAGTQYAALVFYVYFVPSFNAFGHNYKVTAAPFPQEVTGLGSSACF